MTVSYKYVPKKVKTVTLISAAAKKGKSSFWHKHILKKIYMNTRWKTTDSLEMCN